MQTFKDRLRVSTDMLRSLGGPSDALEKRIAGVVDRATSEMMINPDWGVNMELVDIINTDPNTGCYDRVFKALRRRLWKPNPKIQLLTLTLLETCVKNTGTEFQTALSASDFWEDVIRLADPKRKADLQVQDKVLVLVEDCAHALTPQKFKDAYDTMKRTGVRFPTRQAEEIGAGFNLPPSKRDVSAIVATEVSEADQRAIQEALKDLSVQPSVTPPSDPVPYRPRNIAKNGSEKLRSELKFVTNSVDLLKDALGSIPLNEPELVNQDYITDLVQQCKETLPKLKRLVEQATNELILAEALSLNDALGDVLLRYETMSKKARDAKKPLESEEPSLLDLEDAFPAWDPNQGSSSKFGQQPTDNFEDLVPTPVRFTPPPPSDPFDALAAQTSLVAQPQSSAFVPSPTSPQQNATPKQSKDPFEDLISF